MQQMAKALYDRKTKPHALAGITLLVSHLKKFLKNFALHFSSDAASGVGNVDGHGLSVRAY
jgi:hypothetical protein